MLRTALLVLGLASAVQAQSLAVTGPDGRRRDFTATDLAAMPRVSAVLPMEGGGTRAYEGVPLSALAEAVGAPLGKALRGPALADIVVVTARDGYRVALALSDLDPAFHPAPVILADRTKGQPLPPEEGPWRLVIQGDSRAARSARMVKTITVEAAP